VFYINIPIAAGALVAARLVLVESKAEGARPALDIPGAVTVTGGLVALVYAVSGTDTHAWSSAATVVPLAIAAVCIAAFVVIETKIATSPLVPFRLFRSRALTSANLGMLFLGGAMFSMWFFVSLYLQDVLHFSPLTTGLAFLPQTIAIALGAQLSARLVPRVGPRLPFVAGALLSSVGLAWLSRIDANGTYWGSVFGGADLATLGMGLAITPLAFAATSGVAPTEAGLASGVLNTSRQVGASTALAVLATAAANKTKGLLATGPPTPTRQAAALSAGFGRGLAIASVVALVGAVTGLFLPGPPGAAVSAAAPTGRPASLAVETES
jgi:hypothetical protein